MEPKKIITYQCSICRKYYLDEHVADSCCTSSPVAPATPAKKCECGAELKYYYHVSCEPCREKYRFEQAEKIESYDGWIYAESLESHNEGFFESVDDMIEYCEDDKVIPEYVYATKKIVWRGACIDNLLDSLDDFYDEADEHIVDFEELETFITEWNKKQNIVSYRPDYTKVILIKKELIMLVETVIEIISDKLGVSLDKIDNNSLFVDDLGADSLDGVELIIAFEDAYDLVIEDKEIENIKTVGDALSFLRGKGVDEEYLSMKKK